MKYPAFIFAFLLFWVCAPADAQQPISLQIHNGLVTLKTQNAPLPQILAEWARVGGTKIVNGERVTGTPVTLELTNVPERQALDTLLRSVAGYLIAARPAGSAGQSAFDRILILPTSNPPRTPPTPALAVGARPFVPPPVAVAIGDPTQNGIEETPDDATDGNQPAAPRPPGLPVPVRVAAPIIRPAAPPPVMQQPQPEEANAGQEGVTQAVAPTPTNPFGIPLGSSSTPGVIAPVPPQPTQQPQR
jgi:hypothetical protein